MIGSSDLEEEEPSIPSSFETTLLVAILSPTLNQAQLLSAFIGTLSAKKTPTLKPTFRYTSLFLGEVVNYAGQSPVLEWAVRAVSLSHLGRQVEDQHLIQLSRQMYRQALLTLNAALQDPMDGLSSKTLAATILLSFYEVINCTEKDSWIRHAGGAGHLMRLRGPERHRSGLGRVCFLAYRHSLVIEAFLSRSATFLAVKPWLDLSREVQKGMPDRSPISDLVDDFHLLIVEFPGFIQSAQDPNVTIPARRKLLTTGQAHRGNLKVLHKRMMTTLEETDQEIAEQPSASNDQVFPVVYNFPTLAIGSLLCGYWAVLTVINRNLALLENEIAHPPTPAELSTAETRAAPARYHLRNSPSDGGKYLEENLHNSRQSCKAAESLSTSAFLGPLYLIFALRVAYNTFESGGEKDWVLNRLEEVSAHLGIARALLDVQDEEARQREESRRGSAATTSASGSPEASRRPSVQLLGLEGSGRTSVSLQEIEGRGRRQEGTSSVKGKGKGVVR